MDDNTNIVDILTEEGIKLLNETNLNFSEGEYKDTFTKYAISRSISGFWSADQSSVYYDPDEPHTSLNSWTNISVQGWSQTRQCRLITSPVILITEEWCLTRSGSLYKLGQKVSLGQMYAMNN